MATNDPGAASVAAFQSMCSALGQMHHRACERPALDDLEA